MATTQEDQAPDRREKESGKPGVGELRKALAASQKETAAAQKTMEASQKTLRDVKRSLEKTAKKLKKTERDKELVMEAMENYKNTTWSGIRTRAVSTKRGSAARSGRKQ